ncbi:MAG: calcium-binding protein, partial [Pseudomonadota bacterium]
MATSYDLSFDWSNHIRGTSRNDTLRGTSEDEVLNGRDGKDLMYGGAGDDVYIVGWQDIIFENAGQGTDLAVSWARNYALPNNVENIRIETSNNANADGNSLNNVMIGGKGNNVLKGNAGNDIIISSDGIDTYYGGAGRDGYAFLSGTKGADTIADFNVNEDWLDLSDFISDSVQAEAVTNPETGNSGPVTKTVQEVKLVPVTTNTGGGNLKYSMPIDRDDYRVIDLDDISTKRTIKLGSNENVLFLGSDKTWTGDQFKVIGGNHVALVGGTFKPTSNKGPTTINFDDFRGSLYMEGVEIDNSNVGARDALRFGGKNGSRPDVYIQNSKFENVKGA